MRVIGRLTSLLTALCVALTLVGCGRRIVDPPPDPNADIPADPGGAAPAPTLNNVIPSATFSRTPNNEVRIRINLLGMLDPVTQTPIKLDTSNVFVTEDGVLKGIKVSVPNEGARLKTDVAFIVDNSGSMGEEADSVASKIVAFASHLEARGLDVRVGCVGHGAASDQAVYGALNLGPAAALRQYLNRRSGLGRTVGFAGGDSAALASAAANFGAPGGGENSIVGIRFADGHFRWREGANRVYVAFTDEPTQPGGLAEWGTDAFARDWAPGTGRGTVHVVYSAADTSRFWYRLDTERPWELAAITGGTTRFVDARATGLDLTTLPVTRAIGGSRLVEFVSARPTGSHEVVLTVKTPTADGMTVYRGVLYGAPPAASRPPVSRAAAPAAAGSLPLGHLGPKLIPPQDPTR